MRRAGLGERLLSGDAINTASRIQSVAPEMGVAVGLATYEATAAVFDYEELEPATLKGKAEPVRVFHAKAARARFGTDLTRTHDTPFIGREIDLALLKGIFDKTVASSSVQLVTVVGEPGLGKCRMVAELFAYIDARPELDDLAAGPVSALRGGDHLLGAGGDPEGAHRASSSRDPPAVAQEKLDAVLPEGEERDWFRQRLLPLLGIEADLAARSGRSCSRPGAGSWRGSRRSARRCWCSRICTGPTRRCSPSWSTWPISPKASPCSSSARPGRSCTSGIPTTASRLRNVTMINLAPLSQEETARLVSALLDATVIPAELQQPILDRAGGNPLYAEEFVRLLKDRDLLVRRGSSWELREGRKSRSRSRCRR